MADPGSHPASDARGDPVFVPPPNSEPGTRGEWFAPVDPRTGEPGLRFGCTMCGNCCTGPEGYVLVSDDECRALAARLGLPEKNFLDRYTHIMMHGRSLNEKVVDLAGVRAFDCVFLDRETIPGKAICGVYEHRPAQCRTWPFWPSLLREKSAWERAKRTCPGIDKGTLVPIEEIRIRRDTVRI